MVCSVCVNSTNQILESQLEHLVEGAGSLGKTCLTNIRTKYKALPETCYNDVIEKMITPSIVSSQFYDNAAVTSW